MNAKVEEYAKTLLKEGLAKCTEAEVHMFKRMYSHKNLDASVDDIVDNFDMSKFETAMAQVDRTLAKRGVK